MCVCLGGAEVGWTLCSEPEGKVPKLDLFRGSSQGDLVHHPWIFLLLFAVCAEVTWRCELTGSQDSCLLSFHCHKLMSLNGAVRLKERNCLLYLLPGEREQEREQVRPWAVLAATAALGEPETMKENRCCTWVSGMGSSLLREPSAST